MVTTKRRMISPIVRFVFLVETGHYLRHDEVLGEAMTVVVDIKQYEASILEGDGAAPTVHLIAFILIGHTAHAEGVIRTIVFSYIIVLFQIVILTSR